MTDHDEFTVRPGRIRQGGARSGSALRQILASRQRAGGPARSPAGRPSVFGRGRVAGVRAVRQLGAGGRSVVIKTRVVRHHAGSQPLSAHLRYLQRDGVTRDGEPGRLFDAQGDDVNANRFGERCDGDRHHFRFIVSPEDGAELHDLKTFGRELMSTAGRDLGTRLDWVAVEHWNTAHPHIHILVRGVADDGQDLVIARDYIGQGLRARACEQATLELGPRSELDHRRALARDVSSDRWTRLDGQLVRDAARSDGRIDLRPDAGRGAALRALTIARLERLQDLGLATPQGAGRWRLSARTETILKALGRRNDIIARLHQGLSDAGQTRPVEHLAAIESPPVRVTGRVLAMGLDDD